MEQYQLYLLIIVFILYLFLGETYKITAYHGFSEHPLETSRSLFTEFKSNPSDSSLRVSSYPAHINSVKDSHKKQSKGILNSLLGGLGLGGGNQGGGGSHSGGGSEEEIGQESGSGGGIGGLLGGGEGGLLGGGGGGLLGGLTGLLSPVLSILGRTRSEMSSEEFEKLRECGDDCTSEASALKSPISDSVDTEDSESSSFLRNEGMDETSSDESLSEDQGNLVDVDADVLNGNDNPLLEKKSTQCLQCEDNEYAFNSKDFNYANSFADLDTSIISSRSNINKDLGLPSDSDIEKNVKHIGGLRLKRQLDDVGSLVDANISVLDSGKQSGGNNARDESNTKTKEELTKLARSTIEEESKWAKGKEATVDIKKRELDTREFIEKYEQLSENTKRINTVKKKSEENPSKNLLNKEIHNTDRLDTKEKSIEYVLEKKMGDENHLDIIKQACIGSVKDSREKQNKGLLNSLLGGLGSGGVSQGGGGSHSGGGSDEEIGQESGNGGGVGEVLGGGGGGLLGGLTGLLSPVLSILGRSRSEMSSEEFEKSQTLKECGDGCTSEASALKGPISDTVDAEDSESSSFCKNEVIDETSSDESMIEDQGNLVDVDADVLNDNDNPLLKKESTQCLQCEYNEYASNDKASNGVDSIADLDTSIIRSRSNINKDSGIPSDSVTETNIEQIVRLRLTRQLDDVGSLVDANVSVLDSGRQSEGNNADGESSTPTKKELTKVVRSTIEGGSKRARGREAITDVQKREVNPREIIENYEQQLSENNKIINPVQKKYEEDTSESSVNKEINNIDSLDAEEKSLDYIVENKIDDENHLYITKQEQITGQEMRSIEGLIPEEETSEILEIKKEIKYKDSFETERNRFEPIMETKMGNMYEKDDIETNRKICESDGIKEEDDTFNIENGGKSSKTVGSNNEMDIIYGIEIGGKSSINLVSRKMDNEERIESGDMSSGNVERKEEDHIDSIENDSENNENEGRKKMDYMERVKICEKSSENVGNKGIYNQMGTESKEICSENVERKEEDHIKIIEAENKGSKNEESKDYVNKVQTGGEINKNVKIRKIDIQGETESGEMSSKNKESKEIEHTDGVETRSKNSENVGSRETDKQKGTDSEEISSEYDEKKEEGHIKSIETSGKRSEDEGSMEMDKVETWGKSCENIEIKEMGHMDGVEKVDCGGESSENVGSKEIDLMVSVENGGKISENIESKEVDHMDSLEKVDGDGKPNENLGSREMDNQEETESGDLGIETVENKPMGNMDTVEAGENNNENYGSREMDDNESTLSVVTSSEHVGKKYMNTVNWNIIETSGKSNGNEGRSKLDNKETGDISSEYIDNKDMDNLDTIETGDISSENDGSREMGDKVRTESAEMSSENVENKEMNTDNSYNIETSGKNSFNEVSCESENNKFKDMSCENAKNKEMSTMDSIETGANSCGNEGNREMDSEERTDSGEVSNESEEYKRKDCINTKEAGETFGSMEVSNTDFLERESSINSGSKEVDISESSYIIDQTRYSTESDELIRSDDLEESDSSGHVVAKDSSNSVDSNLDDVSVDESYQMLENKNSFEQDEKSNGIMNDYKDSKGSYSPSILIEDFTIAKDSSSSEEHTNYADYSYFEYDFVRENTESSESKEEKSDYSSTVGNGSKESAENIRKGSKFRHYIPFPYKQKYNFADIYRAAISSMYWPLMYRYHPQSFPFKKRLFDVPIKKSGPTAQAKQLEMPYLHRYPTSVAGSDLYGSYAFAHSSPFLSAGEGLGEEEPILGEEEEVGELGRK